MDSDKDVVTAFLEHGTVDRTLERLLPEQLDRVTDLILVADDERKYVDVNQAAVKALGRPKEAIVGQSIDEFFSEADEQPIPDAWQKFIAAGDRYGTCKLRGTVGAIFVYRSRANVRPGLHVAVLRRIK
jgi:PAS domain S-box-containing protein